MKSGALQAHAMNHRRLEVLVLTLSIGLMPVVARAVDYAQIYAAHESMTSVEWKAYTKSVEGSRVCWSGVVVDVREQWFGGNKILVDMDKSGAGVQDVYLEDLGAEAGQYRKDSRVSWCGTIKSILSVFGPQVTFSKPTLN